MSITNFSLLWDHCERHGAKRNELAAKSSFSLLCTGFQTTRYLGSFWFFRWGLWNKKILFLAIWSISVVNRTSQARTGPIRLDPAMMVYDGLFLKRVFFLQTRMGWHFITGIDYMVKNKHFLFHKPHQKNQNFPRYRVVWKPVYDCKNKVVTRSQLSHSRAKFVIVLHSEL